MAVGIVFPFKRVLTITFAFYATSIAIRTTNRNTQTIDQNKNAAQPFMNRTTIYLRRLDRCRIGF